MTAPLSDAERAELTGKIAGLGEVVEQFAAMLSTSPAPEGSITLIGGVMTITVPRVSMGNGLDVEARVRDGRIAIKVTLDGDVVLETDERLGS